ncbi:hypothetical protein A3B51_03690 [Candidatus Curtissbacteria bacterium RIFCSPLOWO2_01_FULL_41_18]|uniref:Uncharacterized protein n=1 Tax=Candidatus Curtissbacteria bacterium RIFCSPLOWO2_01_FULL_41_18 TaxID=1797727 RepID=A0A1F5HK94_9BACT|nr:MAG: hypothetical protein A3B51_03690 [Candidatus Curtissbacteria bacterium RIFCSPLOWO2_01_FULL_41_18]
MTERESDFGADEEGQVRFVQVDRKIGGLNLQIDTDEGFVIGNFLRIYLLSYKGPKIVLETQIVKESQEYASQLHFFDHNVLYQLEGTDIFIAAGLREFGSGFRNLHFVINAPRDIPIVRTQILNK